MLEEENAYLKKNFDVEIALMKDENEILKNQLMEVQNKRNKLTPTIKNNYGSPVRYEAAHHEDIPMFKSNSPFINVKQQYDRVKGEAQEKDRIIEQKNKEIVALTL